MLAWVLVLLLVWLVLLVLVLVGLRGQWHPLTNERLVIALLRVVLLGVVLLGLGVCGGWGGLLR